jgi:hypothetical protein
MSDNNEKMYVLSLELEVEALRAVLRELIRDGNDHKVIHPEQYTQWHKAEAMRKVREEIRDQA